MTASDYALVVPFAHNKCTGQHQHIPDPRALGKREVYADAETWAWKEASKVVDGILNVIAQGKRGNQIPHAYPSDISKIAKAQPGSHPAPGRDYRAPKPQ